MSTSDLAQEIQDAFAGRPYPGDGEIALRRPSFPQYEGEEVWERFRGRDWREILRIGQARELDLSGSMAFLTLKGFVYYLPAFLTLALDVDGPFEVGESLVFKLWSFPEEVAALLAPAEKRAVVHVLEHLARVYDERNPVRNNARVALDHYWAYFTDDELGLSRHDIQK
jgi:hypothetical protein